MATVDSTPGADIASVVARALRDEAGPDSPAAKNDHPWAEWRSDFEGGFRPNAMARMFATKIGHLAAQIVGNETRSLSILRELGTEVSLAALEVDRRSDAAAGAEGVRPLILAPRSEQDVDSPPTVLLLDPRLPRDFQPRRYTGHLPRDYEGLAKTALRSDRFDEPQGSPQQREVARAVGEAGPDALIDLLWIAQPEIVVARHPEMELVGCPSPALEIQYLPPDRPLEVSSVGMFCRDAEGTIGITACHHGTGPQGTEVTVGGLPSRVSLASQIQDIVFIPLPDGYVVPNFARGLQGARTDRAPAQSDPAQFDGRTSGLKATVISSHSPGLLWLDALSQNKVQTPAVVNRGDSGSALIDSDDHVLGFAFRRTKFGEPLEFAEWIWAANALAALGLQPL